ncbi:MAG TPA: hypothetical protein H9979_05990 [Candidatus Megamonas gallistercoris]|nr:hypothetical protein [Candidatus Megamonas gallistercoris]
MRRIITLLMMVVMLLTFSAGVFAQPQSDYDFNRVGDGYHCHYDDGHHYRSGHCW